jgi:hypothetical protein
MAFRASFHEDCRSLASARSPPTASFTHQPMNPKILAWAALAILPSVVPSASRGQANGAPSVATPSCRLALDSIDSKLRQNYAGFLLEVRDARRAAYDSLMRDLARRADATSFDTCFPVLHRYAAWFDDPHLFVYQSPVADSASTARRASTLRTLELDEAGAKAELSRRLSRLDPIEGIWYDGPLRYAVVPDPEGGRGDFVAVVVASDTSAWPVGAIRAELHRTGEGTYGIALLTKSFGEQQLDASIHRGMLLRLSPGMWGRAWPVRPADAGAIDPTDVHRPTVQVRPSSVVFSVPSHDPGLMRRLDSLVAANDTAIRARPLLIIDLRGNEGGASFMSRSLHPYIASADKRTTPFDSGSPVMLSSPAQIAYAKRFTGTDTTAFVRSLVGRLEANPGKLVAFDTSTAPPRQAASYPGSWRVAVLTDRGTVSASEVTVLMALRSTRAKVFGEPTAGALDYQSTQIVGLGIGDRRWALGYPTITAHADLPRRGMRGKGIAPDEVIAWNTVDDAIAEVERRMLGRP